MRVSLLFILVLLIVSGEPARAGSDATSLRLVATTAAGRFTQFSVRSGAIVMHGPAGDSPVTPDLRWSLEGDLQAHAAAIEFSPQYSIRRCAAVPAWPAAKARTFGIVISQRQNRWTDDQFASAIVVAAWLVDGRVERVCVTPAAPAYGSSSQIAAVSAFELDDRTRAGAPVVLVLRDNTFLAPKPLFDEPQGNELAVRMHLVPEPPAPAAVTPADIALRTRKNNESLLHLAARTGRLDWTRALLAGGASPLAEPTPLRVASRCGRRPIVDLLLEPAGSGSRYRASHRVEARTAALNAGHADIAATLLNPRTLHGWEDVFSVALALEDEATIELVRPKLKDSTLRNLRPEVVHALIDCGNVSWVQRVAGAGFKLTQRCDDDGLDTWDHARLLGDPTMMAALPASPTVSKEPRPKNDRSTPTLHDERIWTELEVSSVPRLADPLNPAVNRMLRPIVSTPSRSSGEGLITPTFVPTGSPVGGRFDYTAEGASDLWAVVTVVVERTGVPSRVVVVDSSDGAFGRSVKMAVEAEHFIPGTSDGVAVRTRITLPVVVPP